MTYKVHRSEIQSMKTHLLEARRIRDSEEASYKLEYFPRLLLAMEEAIDVHDMGLTLSKGEFVLYTADETECYTFPSSYTMKAYSTLEELEAHLDDL